MCGVGTVGMASGVEDTGLDCDEVAPTELEECDGEALPLDECAEEGFDGAACTLEPDECDEEECDGAV